MKGLKRKRGSSDSISSDESSTSLSSITAELRKHVDWMLLNVNREWLPKPRDAFHTWASCVLSQKVRFVTSQIDIRGYLYKMWGDNVITPTRVLALTMEQQEHLQKHGVSNQQLALLQTLAHLHNDEPTSSLWNPPGLDVATCRKQYPHLRGVGPWTCQSVQIYARLRPDVLLQDDGYVMFHLSKLCTSYARLSAASRRTVWTQATSHVMKQRTIISLILWRLKKTSTWKVLEQQRSLLSSDDFHGEFTTPVSSVASTISLIDTHIPVAVGVESTIDDVNGSGEVVAVTVASINAGACCPD